MITRPLDRLLSCLLLLALGQIWTSSALAARSTWLRYESPQAVLYTDTKEAEARMLLLEMARVEAIVATTPALASRQHGKITLVWYQSRKEFRKFTNVSDEFDLASGGYARHLHGNTMVAMRGPFAELNRIVAARAYILNRFSERTGQLPVWFERGRHQLYSELAETKGRITYGHIVGDIEWRYLKDPKHRWTWQKLSEFNNKRADMSGPRQDYYDFVQNSWLFTHFLLESADHPPFDQVQAFAHALKLGEPVETALPKYLGLTLEEADQAIKEYVEMENFAGRVLGNPPEDKDLRIEQRPVTPTEQLLISVNTHLFVNNYPTAEYLILDRLVEEPDNATLWAALASCQFESDRDTEAQASAAEAVRLGDPSNHAAAFALYQDLYARAYEPAVGECNKAAQRALAILAESGEERTAWLVLGMALAYGSPPTEPMLEALRYANTVCPADPMVVCALAMAEYYRVGHPEGEARLRGLFASYHGMFRQQQWMVRYTARKFRIDDELPSL